MKRGWLNLLVWVSAIGGAICLLLYLFVFDTVVLPGDDALFVSSIAPTLHAQDRILVVRGGTPTKIGQLARCASPDPRMPFVIGRVFGYEGDVVELKNERVFTNGKPLESRHMCPEATVPHPVTGQPTRLACRTEETGAWTYDYLAAAEFPEGERRAKVEPGKMYIVSDNRHLHQDSRDFGPVDAASCEHVVFRLWGESFVDSSRRFTLLW